MGDDLRGRRVDGRRLRRARASARGRSPRVAAVRFRRNFGQHPAMHAGLVRARGEIVVTMDGDLQNCAGGHSAARRGDRRRRRRGERAARRPPRPVGADAPVEADQRHAAPLHRRRHLRLRLRVQRVSPRGDRADAAGDRQAEVHEGARALRRRERDRGRRPARGARRLVPLLAAPADAAGAPRARRLLAAADPVDRRGARHRLLARRRRARHLRASSTGSTRTTSPGRCSRGVAILFVLGVQGFILALVGEYLGRIQRDVEGRPLYTIEKEL